MEVPAAPETAMEPIPVSRQRQRMVIDLASALNTKPVSEYDLVSPPFTAITSVHWDTLGALLHAAFVGTIDYDGESLEDAKQEINEAMSGKYGEVINGASRIATDETGTAIAAVIFVREVSRSDASESHPLLAFTMTHPNHQGKGLGSQLISYGLQSLHSHGCATCELVVTIGNSAQRIYERLGFTPK
jgi:predicted N-acetyltransferase YhbS